MKRILTLCLFIVMFTAECLYGEVYSIEFDTFSPKRVGIDTYTLGLDDLMVGFDYTIEGLSIPTGTIVDNMYATVGISCSAIVTEGSYAGEITNTQALDYAQSPGGDDRLVATSPPNILSAVDPSCGPTYSGEIAGTSTLIINFIQLNGDFGWVQKVGAFQDYMFGYNILSAWSLPNATGELLGQVSATGPGDFMGLYCSEGIASITFSGYSTEIDDIVFSPVVPEPCTLSLLAIGGLLLRKRKYKPMI